MNEFGGGRGFFFSTSIFPWRIPDSTFTTSGLEKSHQAQNELYHCSSWPPRNLSACVVISVCLHVFIIAPAVCLRLTCLPEHYVKWVWPKKLPCGCMLLCLLAAGMQTLGDEPLPTLAICQRPCSAPWVRSPGEECQAKITGHTHMHTDGFPQACSSHWLYSHLLLINMQQLLRVMKLERTSMINASDCEQP